MSLANDMALSGQVVGNFLEFVSRNISENGVHQAFAAVGGWGLVVRFVDR